MFKMNRVCCVVLQHRSCIVHSFAQLVGYFWKVSAYFVKVLLFIRKYLLKYFLDKTFFHTKSKHFSRLSIIHNTNDWRNFIGSGKFIACHFILFNDIWPIIYNSCDFIRYRSERIYHKSWCMRLDGTKLSILCDICNALPRLYYGNILSQCQLHSNICSD